MAETNLQGALEHGAHSEPSLKLLHKSSVNYCEVVLGSRDLQARVFRISFSALRAKVGNVNIGVQLFPHFLVEFLEENLVGWSSSAFQHPVCTNKKYNLKNLTLGFVAASVAINISDVPWRSYTRN